MPKWFTAKVVDILQETPHVRRFKISIPDVASFDFKPGQFITMDLPIGEKRLERWRSYSIASAPDGSNIIELCIVKKYDGKGTQYLFDEVTIGSELTVKGPDGAFTLPESKLKSHELVMICTGTGIAPFLSFIQYIMNNELDYKSLHLIFGARYKSDILYSNLLHKFANEFQNFKYDIVLSREEDWNKKGYVHQVFEEEYRDDFENKLFYLCGWSVMIDEAVERLKVLGVMERNIIYELYG
jgi:ferredoxin-NADP reductase